MRILTVGFNDEYVKELEKELDEYFICIVDNAKDMYVKSTDSAQAGARGFTITTVIN